MSHKVRVNLPYMSSNKDSAFCQASNKWVTFNDMVDDAMEGGKLVARSDNSQHNLNRRRASMIDGDSGEFWQCETIWAKCREVVVPNQD